ncbi:hypothetical protein QKC54_gp0613 [Megavirus baoshan]|uniref:Uncharacterized protein n=1 Tax=Megavirus baoshan TaxID=2496520 RepID=A0A3S8UWU5_9VIRU|nr:hypothetical protein QKC54_gp0613 [Megavirus baoshan]AZL89223.1 hypothetical protein Mb0459 [Megavirus baoshan]
MSCPITLSNIKYQYFENASYIVLFLIFISNYFFSKFNRTVLRKSHNILYRITLVIMRLELMSNYFIYDNNQLNNLLMKLFLYELTNIIPVLCSHNDITSKRIIHIFCYIIPLLQLLFFNDKNIFVYMYIHHACDIMRDINGIFFNSIIIIKLSQILRIVFVSLAICAYMYTNNIIMINIITPYIINTVHIYDLMYGINN